MLHSVWRLGGDLTDPWVELQSANAERFDSRLLGMKAHRGHPRSPSLLLARDRPGLWLAYRVSQRSRGLTTAWLARAFRRHPPTVLHAHYGHRASCQIPLARELRAPLVASFYGDDATHVRFTRSRRWLSAYARLFAFASAVIAEGPAMAARLEALGCPAEKLRVVRLPADAASLEGIKVRSADGFLASLAGRFTEKKGFDFGIRAFARALRGRSDARLLIVGGGEQEEELRRIAAEERLDGQVTWAGRLPFERFMSAIGRAHVGMYPSRTARHGDSEGGAPVTLAEAQWLGVPSIVSAHDDLPFLAAPGGSVVLPPDDLDAWAEVLLGLYRDRGRLAAMRPAAKAFARAHHSPVANVRARESIYDCVSR